MEPRVSFITLAVADRDASRRFYVEGLGWPAAFDDIDVIMLQVGPQLVLSLWERDAFAAEVGEQPSSGLAPITLAHNVATRTEVDAALEQARRAGASSVTAAEHREWGGYSGYFADPDGFRWEVCWNPGEIGKVVLPEVSEHG
ncbi:VOC family protein [Rudaeicoccus suwonensis]|uniref:VOC domain-containing protein n=1 Tax=Rudaeicoccus suwonensis TaxID=657409 RepID=A0A561E3E6_9MICO|nr:VOC family protein [Rudaeicoccus suwonensis]TWE10133.1 hypothetical protein BKA23_2485 [Rudaeicoccus suwonensis]